MHNDRILFVVRSFSRTGAQPIRFRQITSHLKDVFDIHVLELTYSKAGTSQLDGITLHSIEYSTIGRKFNPDIPQGPVTQGRSGRFTHTIVTIKRIIRSLFFPDSMITEGRRIKREVVRLTQIHNYGVVVLSAFPFTVLLCAGALKRKTSARVILDLGDPFYRNSRNGFLRDIMARSFESIHLRFIDRLIVTNEMTRAHYLRTYYFLDASVVQVVAMGCEASLTRRIMKEPDYSEGAIEKSRFSLVYAGQLYRKMREPYELYRAVAELNQGEHAIEVTLDIYGSFSREFSVGYQSVPGIRFLGQISHNAIADVYHNAGAVVFIDNAYGMQTPGKVFEVALINRPVLFIAARDESPALEVIRGLKHIVVTRNSARLIAGAIRELIGMNPEYPSDDQVRSFLWETRAEQYRHILSDVLNG